MAGVRCTAVQTRPPAFLDLPSVTLEECQQLLPDSRGPGQAVSRRGGGAAGPEERPSQL